jgi:hypothetical protein
VTLAAGARLQRRRAERRVLAVARDAELRQATQQRRWLPRARSRGSTAGQGASKELPAPSGREVGVRAIFWATGRENA